MTATARRKGFRRTMIEYCAAIAAQAEQVALLAQHRFVELEGQAGAADEGAPAGVLRVAAARCLALWGWFEDSRSRLAGRRQAPAWRLVSALRMGCDVSCAQAGGGPSFPAPTGRPSGTAAQPVVMTGTSGTSRTAACGLGRRTECPASSRSPFVSAPTIAMSDTRNLQLGQLIDLLRDQSTRRLDVKAGSGRMRAAGGHLVLDETEPELTLDGVTMTVGVYRPNDIANAGLADKLGIPSAYLRKLAAEHPDLYDENVNGWLTRTDRRFLIRVLRNNAGGGIARAVLSTKYARIDNLDVAMSALEGIRRAGTAVDVVACDLTDAACTCR